MPHPLFVLLLVLPLASFAVPARAAFLDWLVRMRHAPSAGAGVFLCAVAACTGLVAEPASSAVDITWVFVGDAGNPADTATNCVAANCGSVSYDYYISKFEVTTGEYAEFLNAKATSDPLGLYNSEMDRLGFITRSGEPGNYAYTVKSGWDKRPAVFILFFEALRFTNWLNNGQGNADTEGGAYTLLGGTPVPSNWASVTRNPDATIVLANENEWYKAAYYSGNGVYFDYPAGTNVQTRCEGPTAVPNRANCGFALGGSFESEPLAQVGSYTGSASPYGTYDQGGNVHEWLEGYSPSGRFVRRGGFWAGTTTDLAATSWGTSESHLPGSVGFRVVTLVSPCDDGIDNDDDGLVDLQDPGCVDALDVDEKDHSGQLPCDDNVDNDSDQLVDLADPGCESVMDSDEWSDSLACDDGIDNDGDLRFDFSANTAWADPGCRSVYSAREDPQCQDGLNNDSQGGIDFDGGASLDLDPVDGFVDARFNPATPPVGARDLQCTSAWNNLEASGVGSSSCGLGPEILLLTPALWWLRRGGKGRPPRVHGRPGR